MKNNRTLKKMAIANRGEVAVRLISLCKEMGIQPILLYSSADKNSLATRLSPEKICIGPAEATESYLNPSAVIEGALSMGADAIHPGYGFLSEKASFAEACLKKDISFIGPPVSCLKIFGDKTLSREAAIKCGLPVLPATTGKSKNADKLLEEACKIGFPVMIKSTHGGGGRGLRIISCKEDWHEALASAQRETQLAFGSSEIFIEKYLPLARHIEVQIFVDVSGRVFYLFDRDCSIQRKQQKIIEEAPAGLPETLRRNMEEAAVELLTSVNYLQAATVEFLCSENKFYFMEVNPRIQVECPVTEMILGIDLMRAQILTAQDLSPFIQDTFKPRGHSLQARIYAEDMHTQLPVFGTLGTCEFPTDVYFDRGYESGDEVPGFYDSMLGKLVVHDENRTRAISKLKRALSETVIFGLKTNLNFLQDLIRSPEFIQHTCSTRFVEDIFLKSWQEKTLDPRFVQTLRQAFRNTPKTFSSLQGNFNPWVHFSKKE